MSNKPSTPMKRFSNHFQKLEMAMRHYHRMSKPIVLNKADSHYNSGPYISGQDIESKGVDSDFIRIYEDRSHVVDTKNVNDYRSHKVYNSVAFVFDYIDVAEPTVRFTRKTNNQITSSTPMTLDDFRVKFNQVNKELDIESKQFDDNTKFFDFLEEIFMEEVYNPSSDVEAVLAEIEKESSIKTDIIEQSNKQLDKLIPLFRETEKEIDKEVKASPEYKEIVEIKKRLQKLESKVNKKRKMLEEEKDIKGLKARISDWKRKKDMAVAYKNRIINKVLSSQPNFIKDMVKQKLDS